MQNAQEHILSAEPPKASNDASSLMRDKDPVQEVVQRDHMRPQRLRIVLYSSARTGLGHMRRNLLIAQTLACSHLQATILLITGAREACAFAMPAGIDCLTLPALRKEADGQCKPRYLDISLRELIALRAKTIRAALEAFQPDVLIADKMPRGVVRELDPALEFLRARGHTRCVLGLRDILDDPESVHREWCNEANEDAIRNYYDAVWVYGDPAVYDLVREYHLSHDIAAKVCYTGYLDQSMRLEFAAVECADPLVALALPLGHLVLCMVGGGQDGDHLAEAFTQADLPPTTNGVLVTGPFMSLKVRQRLSRRAAENPRLRVLGFITEPELLLRRADRVIAMGGYNTVCEVLSYEKHALIVPRVNPRREQLIRAERLRDLSLLDVLHPDKLNPRALTEWLARDMRPPPRARDRIDLNGLSRLPHLLEEVLAAPPHPAQSKLLKGGIQYVE